MIKEFLERNKPVFTIGIIVLILFIGIIIYSQLNPAIVPNLKKVSEESSFVVEEEPPAEVLPPSKEELLEFDKKYEPIKIKCAQGGFIPKNAKTIKGQLVKWTNETENDIYLVQKMPTYSELLDPTLIKPGETFEFRLNKAGIWTYEERETKRFGSILVKENPTP